MKIPLLRRINNNNIVLRFNYSSMKCTILVMHIKYPQGLPANTLRYTLTKCTSNFELVFLISLNSLISEIWKLCLAEVEQFVWVNIVEEEESRPKSRLLCSWSQILSIRTSPQWSIAILSTIKWLHDEIWPKIHIGQLSVIF